MKKSLVALAVLAASGAAMAQSSVTMYGILDVYAASVKNENNTAAGGAGKSLTQSVLNSGAVNGSRWGMKGSEDLGGGLKAVFDLQAGINLDDGSGTSTSATAFSRQSWVGLGGDFGTVRLGRTTTPFDDVNGTSDAVFDSALSPMNSVFKTTKYSARQSNMFYYQAPTVAGFSGAASYALGEDKTASTGATSTTSFDLTYGAGPVAVQFAYQVQDGVDTTTVADAKFTRLGGSYDLGVAKIKANYGKATNVASAVGVDATDFQIGADFPVSTALTLSASYATSKDSKTTGFEATRKGFGFGAAYTLSKRTFVFGGLESDTATTSATTADAKHTVFAAGMQHRF